MNKKIIFSLLACSFVGIAFAANSLIYLLPGNQVSNGPNSFASQQIRTISDGDLRFMNQNDDTQIIDDYFSGYYYDSMYGTFRMDISTGDRVRVLGTVGGSGCPATHDKYKLTGYAYNPDFGYIDFDYNTTEYVYLCKAKTSGQIGTTLPSFLGGYAYSPYIGFQNFSGIELNTSVIPTSSGSLTQSARKVKIIGIVNSLGAKDIIGDQFLQDVRVLGKTSKSDFRKQIQKNVTEAINGVAIPSFTDLIIDDLSGEKWENTTPGIALKEDSVRYFSLNNQNVEISGDTLAGVKTLIVEGGNVYIRGNITGSGLLGIIVLEKNGGGNIYIDPSVTDIHAVMYADRSVISYSGGNEYDGSTTDDVLKNQLYIKGALFSENTIGGARQTDFSCPFYVSLANCDTFRKAAKYDLNYLRRYVLVQELDENGNIVGPKKPQYGASQSLQTPLRPDFAEYPVIIEYDSRIQQKILPIF